MSRRRRRDAAHETIALGVASGEELFGGKLAWDHGGYSHRDAHTQLSLAATFRRLPYLVATSARLAWGADRPALLAVAAASIGRGVTSAFSLLATNRVLVELFAAGPTPGKVRAALPALIALALSGILAALLGAASTVAAGRLEPKVERAAEVALMSKVSRVEQAKLEDGDFKRLLQSARWGTDASRRMISYTIGIVTAAISLAAAGTVLTVLHPVLLPLLVLITVPQAWGAVRDARRRYASVQNWIDHGRQQREVEQHLGSLSSGPEIRVHGAGRYLLHHYRRMAAASEAEETRLVRAEAGTDLVASSLAGLATGLTYVVLGWLVWTGRTDLAASGTAVLAVRSGTYALGQLVLQIQYTYKQSLFLEDFNRACAIADEHAIPTGGRPIERFPDEIRLEKVSYTYPDRDRPAVDAVSLTIRRGEIIALVGENGSGKTTLAKLVAGLYRPHSGRILWDGTDDTELDRDQLFDRVALISQSFVEWPFTAAANVRIGRAEPEDEAPDARTKAALPRPRTGLAAEDDQAGHGADPELEAAARYAEADQVVDELPRGWDTLLDRSYVGGVALSGGQWQKILLGRGVYRDADLLIADEPTSALDARAEITAFEKIRALADRGHTIVLITHRLASTRMADRIYVLDHGALVEQGTHAELLDGGGQYAVLFRMQKDQYTGVGKTVPGAGGALHPEHANGSAAHSGEELPA
ncbi:MAG: ABC transporter ATP-binding protein [Streptomycetaceae bacterium]|nr:ABC transporter ATP-binding protein [Streptomycetaceae bacterium]